MKRIVVPDASVILKWALPPAQEKDADRAAELLDAWLAERLQLLLPPLWVYEVGNVLALKAPELADELLTVLVGYDIEEVGPTPQVRRAAFRLMESCRTTFCDAVYHAVALERGGQLVTADDAYVRKAAKEGSVLRLRDFRTSP